MMEPLEAIENIYTIAKLIYDQVQLAKANKAQCRQLAERVRIIEKSLRGLQQVSSQQHFKEALHLLKTKLNECADFISGFSGKKKWYKKVLNAGNHAAAFDEMNAELAKAMQQLNIGFDVQQLVNQEADKAAAKADKDAIKDYMDEALALNKAELEEIKEIKLNAAEQHDVLAKKMDSMRECFTVLAGNAGARRSVSGLDRHNQIPYFALMFYEVIGKGGFGTVYRGEYEAQPVAIKRIEKGDLAGEGEKQFIHEVGIMARLRSPYITQFYGACFERGRACLAMEYMAGESLEAAIKEKRLLSPAQKKSIVLSVARGLHYLHSQKVIHADVKTGNILLNEHTEAKLTDFGLSQTRMTSIVDIRTSSQALRWQAPECLMLPGDDEPLHSPASDVYSFGLVVWSLYTGQAPFAALPEKDILEHLSEGAQETLSDAIPKALARLIQACWAKTPTERPSTQHLIDEITAFVDPGPPSPNPAARHDLGMLAKRERRHADAKAHFERAVEKGSYAASMTQLGIYCVRGQIDGRADKQQAYTFFEKAAEAEDPQAMFNLGQMLEYGDGVDKDLATAKQWYEKGGNCGNEACQGRLARVAEKLAEEEMNSTLKAMPMH